MRVWSNLITVEISLVMSPQLNTHMSNYYAISLLGIYLMEIHMHMPQETCDGRDIGHWLFKNALFRIFSNCKQSKFQQL